MSWNMPLFKVWSKGKPNKKFVVAENFAELVSTIALSCLEGGGFDPLWSSNRWGIWPSKLATWRGIWPKFLKKVKCPGVCPGGGGDGRFWNWPVHDLVSNIVFPGKPHSFIAQLVEHCTGVCGGHWFESRSNMNYMYFIIRLTSYHFTPHERIWTQ